MENNTKDILTGQVRAYLIELKLWEADKYQVYQHFLGQCNQFGVTEEEFFKEILKPAHASINFEELIDDPDPRNDKNTSVMIFNEKLHSLKRLGQVLFDNQNRLGEYFEDVSLLKAHVDTLTTGDHALEYAKLFREEPEPEKRWLRIIYHLNPKLPYRIGQHSFPNLKAILDEAFKDKYFYNQVYNEFVSGRLLIWLHECDTAQFDRIPAGRSYNAYLKFIYNVDATYPFYLDDSLFANPYELVLQSRKEKTFRTALYKHINNEQLFVWFESMGKAEWKPQYFAQAVKLREEGLKGDDLADAAVEKLIRIIDPSIVAPELKASVEKLQFVGVEAGKQINAIVTLQLKKTGYLRANIVLDQLIEGIRLDKTELTFFDLAGHTSHNFVLFIDPLKLTKDKLYELKIRIITDYQTLEIPVEIKTVFPVRTYVLCVLKYGLIGFVFMGGIRFLLGMFLQDTKWLEPGLVTGNFSTTLPHNYLAYIFVLAVLIAGILISVPLIKKVEKI